MTYDLKCSEESEKDDSKGISRELLNTRSIMISEPISDALAKRVYAQLLVLNERSKTDPIKVFINSPGGDADSGFGIYDMLRFVEAPVTTLVCGLCASAAVTIFLAAKKGKNFSLPHSRFLLHQPSTGVRGSASDLVITACEIDKIKERYNQIVAEVTGKKTAKVAEDADRDFWLNATEAVDYGLAAKVISSLSEIS